MFAVTCIHGFIPVLQTTNMHRAEIGNTTLARAVPNDKNNMT